MASQPNKISQSNQISQSSQPGKPSSPVQPRITWEAPEFRYRAKSVSWYWLTIIVAVFLIGAAVWQKNFLFGVFVVIAEMLLLVWAHREPPVVRFSITEKALEIGGESFPYADIVSFSAEEDDEDWSTITLRFRRRFRPTLKIQVPRGKMEIVEKAMKLFVPKVDADKSLVDVIEDFIGF